MNIETAINILKINHLNDLQDLKSQFRKLARELHPDRNPSGEAHNQFLALVQAYEFAQIHFDDILAALGIEESDDTIKSEVAQIDDVFSDLFDFGSSGRVIGYQEPEELYLTIEEFLNGVQKKRKKVGLFTMFGLFWQRGAQR